jgi:hypothetical protein
MSDNTTNATPMPKAMIMGIVPALSIIADYTAMLFEFYASNVHLAI